MQFRRKSETTIEPFPLYFYYIHSNLVRKKTFNMLKSISFILVILFIVSSCTTYYYNYGAKSYHSKEAAIQAARDDYYKNLAKINPSNTPLQTRLLCVLPTRNLLERSIPNRDSMGGEALFGYFISTIELTLEMQVEALRRRGIYSEVIIERSESTEWKRDAFSQYESILYFVITQGKWGWLLRLSNDKEYPLYFDRAIPKDLLKTVSWLDSIERLARGQF